MRKSIKDMTLADKLLFVFLFIGSFAGIFAAREAMPQSKDVLIEIDGKPVYTYPLSIDRLVSVQGPYGSAQVEIRQRKVRVSQASCQNRICVREGWVSRGVIVCLPGKITVFVAGNGDSIRKDIDAVTG